MVVLRGAAVSYERCTPVHDLSDDSPSDASLSGDALNDDGASDES